MAAPSVLLLEAAKSGDRHKLDAALAAGADKEARTEVRPCCDG